MDRGNFGSTERAAARATWFERTTSAGQIRSLSVFAGIAPAWGEADAAGNDNYYATRGFIESARKVTPENYRSAGPIRVGWYRRGDHNPLEETLVGKTRHPDSRRCRISSPRRGAMVASGRARRRYTPFEFDLTDSLRRVMMDG